MLTVRAREYSLFRYVDPTVLKVCNRIQSVLLCCPCLTDSPSIEYSPCWCFVPALFKIHAIQYSPCGSFVPAVSKVRAIEYHPYLCVVPAVLIVRAIEYSPCWFVDPALLKVRAIEYSPFWCLVLAELKVRAIEYRLYSKLKTQMSHSSWRQWVERIWNESWCSGQVLGVSAWSGIWRQLESRAYRFVEAGWSVSLWLSRWLTGFLVDICLEILSSIICSWTCHLSQVSVVSGWLLRFRPRRKSFKRTKEG